MARASSRATPGPRGPPAIANAAHSYSAYPERQDIPYTEWQAALQDQHATDFRKSYYESSPVVAVAGSTGADTYDSESTCSLDDRQAYPYDIYEPRSDLYDSPASYSPSEAAPPFSPPFDPRAAASPADSTMVLRGALPPARAFPRRPLGFVPLEYEECTSEEDRTAYSDDLESFDAHSSDSEDDRRGRRGDRGGDFGRRRTSYASTEDSFSDGAYDRRSGGDRRDYEHHALTMSRRRGQDVADELHRHRSWAEDGRQDDARRHGSRHSGVIEDARYSILQEPPAAPSRSQEPPHALLAEDSSRAPRSRKVSAPPAPLARPPSMSSPIDDVARTPQPRARRASVVGAGMPGAIPSSRRSSAIPTRWESGLDRVPERRQSPPGVRHEDAPHPFGPRPRRTSSRLSTVMPSPDRRSASYVPGWAGSESSGSTASTRTLITPPPFETHVVSHAEARARKPSIILPQAPSMPILPPAREHSMSPRDRRMSVSPRDRRESMSISPRDRRDSPLASRDAPTGVPPNHRVSPTPIARRPSVSSPTRVQPAPVYPPEPPRAPVDYQDNQSARQRSSRRFSDSEAPRARSPDPLPVPPPRRRHSDGDQTPTDASRGVKWREGLVMPSPILTCNRRKGWYNRKGDQLWTNEGAYRPAMPQEEFPPDLDSYPDAGEGWMNEEGKRIDMKHRLVPKPPLRSVLKTNSGSL